MLTTLAPPSVPVAVPAPRDADDVPSTTGGRYLFFTNECVGLGHLRRNLTVARAVRSADPASSSLIVTGSSLPDDVVLPGVDTIKLPALSRDLEGQLRSPSLPGAHHAVTTVRAQLALASALAYQPDVVVVDKLPLGLGEELVPTLRALRAEGRCRVVLGLRDIEDDPHVVRVRWAAAGTLRTLARYYDEVLVYGPEAGLDALSCASSDRPVLPVRHVGYVGAPLPAEGPTDLPADYLLVTSGGGADGMAMARAVLAAVRRAPLGLTVVLVAGPLMPLEQVQQLHELARGLDVRVVRSRSDMASVVVGARAVVCMAGYNTVSEVLRAGKPALLVPRVRPSREQLIRARLLAERGVADVLHPDDLDPDVVRDALEQLLGRAAPRVDHGLYDRARRAASALTRLAAA